MSGHKNFSIHVRLFAVLCFVLFGGIVVNITSSASAADVMQEHCFADVSPATGVSVHVAQNDECVVKFTSNSTVTWTRPSGVTSFEILVVAGGGGGGGHPSGDPGGGGGGAVVHVPDATLNDATYQVSVGGGGRGNDAGPCGNPWFSGRDGENSVFSAADSTALITANGGAGGGGACATGRQGGSGGGAHCGGSRTAATKGEVDASISGARIYGNEGGSSAGCGAGAGGGGGASTPGSDGTATESGDGGEGIALDVLGTGSPIVYASGGGGGFGGAVANPTPPGEGGTNGGDGKHGDGATGPEHQGVDGTGSGGGAQLCPETTPNLIECPAGKGGDGVVLIRFTPTVRPVRTTVPVETTVPVATTLPTETTVEPVVIETQQVAQTTRRVNRNTKQTTPTTISPSIVMTTTTSSSTTVVPVASTAPNAPTSEPGEAKVVIDGQTSEMSITRLNDQLSISFGALSSTMSSVTSNGTRRPLDDQGNVRFEEGDSLQLAATGFAVESDIEVWLFSEPRDLGIIRTTVSGEAESLLTVPTDIAPGHHRIVVTGTSRSGSKVIVAVGIIVGDSSNGVTTAQKFFIALPISLAIIAGLVIPTRRRRKAEFV